MELNAREIKRAVEAPPAVPDAGSELERFDPLAMAQVIQHEASKAEAMGLSHLRITMNMQDAHDLARFLQRGALLGA